MTETLHLNDIVNYSNRTGNNRPVEDFMKSLLPRVHSIVSKPELDGYEIILRWGNVYSRFFISNEFIEDVMSQRTADQIIDHQPWRDQVRESFDYLMRNGTTNTVSGTTAVSFSTSDYVFGGAMVSTPMGQNTFYDYYMEALTSDTDTEKVQKEKEARKKRKHKWKQDIEDPKEAVERDIQRMRNNLRDQFIVR